MKALTSNKNGEPGLAIQANVREGDLLIGINFEYFNSRIKLMDIIKVINGAKSFVTMHFKRNFLFEREVALSRSSLLAAEGSPTPERPRTHKLVGALLALNLLPLDAADPFGQSLLRLKQRTMAWDSGTVTARVRLRDVVVAPVPVPATAPAAASAPVSAAAASGGSSAHDATEMVSQSYSHTAIQWNIVSQPVVTCRAN